MLNPIYSVFGCNQITWGFLVYLYNKILQVYEPGQIFIKAQFFFEIRLRRHLVIDVPRQFLSACTDFNI